MDIHEREAEADRVVVDIGGPIESGGNAPAVLLDRLRAVTAQGYKLILLNVAELTYVDSVLLGAIVQAYVSVIRSGGTLKLVHVTKRFRELLALTKLDRVIESLDSEDR